jgi:hypothetical protein
MRGRIYGLALSIATFKLLGLYVFPCSELELFIEIVGWCLASKYTVWYTAVLQYRLVC